MATAAAPIIAYFQSHRVRRSTAVSYAFFLDVCFLMVEALQHKYREVLTEQERNIVKKPRSDWSAVSLVEESYWSIIAKSPPISRLLK